MNDSDRQNEHYNKIADGYYSARKSRNYILHHKLLWSYFLHNKPELRKDSMDVLEPMCGFAYGKQIIEQNICPNFNYEGFDSCDKIVKATNSMYPEENIFQMDATEFVPTKEYDIVILIGALHHIPHSARNFVGTVYNALKKGGYFINYEATYNNRLYRKARNIIYKLHPMFEYETEDAFELKELNDIYLSNKFEITDQIYSGLLTYILYGNPDVFPWLNIGNEKTVQFLFNMEKKFFRSSPGRKLSFTTLTLLKK